MDAKSNRTSQRKRVRIDNITILFLKGLGSVVRYGQVFIFGIVIAVTYNKYKKHTDMKRIITIILMCLPFVAFGQTDYVDRLMKTDEYEIMLDEITYKEPLEFNTLAEAFSFIGRANRTENVRVIEDEELGIVSYKTLDVVRTVSMYGMIFEAKWTGEKRIGLEYKPEREDYFGSKEYSSVEEAREAYKAATSVNGIKEYRRYMQPTEEELRAILKAVKEDCAPNSEIKKTTLGGEVRKTIFIADIYQIGNYEIDVAKSDGIDLITIYNIPVRI